MQLQLVEPFVGKMSSPNNPAKCVSDVAKIIWELEDFQNLGSPLKVKHFSIPTNDRIKFQLSCFPNRNFPSFGDNHTFIYLYLDVCDKTHLVIRYRMSILNENGDNWKTQEGEVTYVANRLKCGGHFQIYREYLVDPANKLLVNGNLKIYFEVEDITDKIDENQILKSNQHQDFPPNKLAEDYQSLLEGGKFSDASLIVGEKKLMVHKNILSARSKVFAAMFENDCEEKRQNRVEITDISAEVCQQMLSYIYTGTTPDLDKYAEDLFVAADKYQLEHLKAICEQHLSSKLEVDTAAKTLLVADMHNATVLKTNCIEYIIKHGEKVIASEGWKALIKARPELGFELFEQIYKKK